MQIQAGECRHSDTVVCTADVSLGRNFSWTLAGNLVYAACQWGYLVLLAQLSRPEVVGHFALGLAISAPVFMLCNLNLRAVQATDAENAYPLGDFLRLRFVTSCFALIAVVAVVEISGYHGTVVALTVLVIAAMKFVESLIGIYYGHLQKHEKMDWIAKSMMLRGVVSLILFGVVLMLTRELVAALCMVLVVWIGFLLLYDIPASRKTLTVEVSPPATSEPEIRSNKSMVRTIFMTALPLGFVMMFNSLNANVPKYFIEFFCGSYDLGIYAALAYIMVAGTTLIASLGQAAVPRLAKYHASSSHPDFIRLATRLVFSSITIGAGVFLSAVVLGRPLLNLFYGASYAAEHQLFMLLMFVAMFSFLSSMLGYLITAAHEFRTQVPIAAVSVLINGLLSFYLIERLGLAGVIWSLLAVFVSQILLKGFVLWRVCRPGRLAALDRG